MFQPVGAKLGEIKFRAKISDQHLGIANYFANEPQRQEFVKIFSPKLKETEKLFRSLAKKGVPLSPYLEIGSEHALRPSLLENKFNSHGIASDISIYSLAKAKKYAKLFNFKKVPKIVACDAYNLPFKSKSFPLIFIYETLHHFPDPRPVLEEIRRVLAPGGICIIGGDPIKQHLQIKLWRRPNKLRFWEKLLKISLVLPFISQIGKTETQYGIIETSFDLKTWQKALSIFAQVEARLNSYPFGFLQTIKKGPSGSWTLPSIKTRLALAIFGGGLEAICQKVGREPQKSPKSQLEELLICPNCLKNYQKEISLSKNNKIYCPNCSYVYQRKNRVLILLEKRLEKLLSRVQA